MSLPLPSNIKMISLVFPCRNEEKSIEPCLTKANQVLNNLGANFEIIVSDSSQDNSAQLAKKFGAKVVTHNKVGYGNAYKEGFKEASGDAILMADMDCSYDPEDFIPILERLGQNCDLVIGNRFAYQLPKGSMPALNKYLGNPFLSGVLRKLFSVEVKDCHCGIRGIKAEALHKLNLKSPGMEFASEMIIKARLRGLIIDEVPVHYNVRVGLSKLNRWSDGLRHLKLIFSFFLKEQSQKKYN